MSRLDKAIADFEDETLELSLGERISGLRQALLFVQFEKIKSVNSRAKVLAEDDERVIEITKWFKELEKLYTLQLRMNKITGKSEDSKSDNEWLKKYKESNSSLGSIVRNMNEKTA